MNTECIVCKYFMTTDCHFKDNKRLFKLKRFCCNFKEDIIKSSKLIND